MNKKSKYILIKLILIIIILGSAFCFCMGGLISVFGATYDAQIGSTKYESIEDAVQAVRAGQTITVLRNTQFTYSIDQAHVPYAHDFTIDLNGHTISNRDSATQWGNYSIGIDNKNITVKNGTVKTGSANPIYVGTGGTCTLIDVKLYSGDFAALAMRGDSCEIKGNCVMSSTSECGIYNHSTSTLTISGNASISSGSYRAIDNRGKCIINSGTINGGTGIGIYNEYGCKLQINGGTVKSSSSGTTIQCSSKEIIDNNVTISSSASVSGNIVNLYARITYNANGGTCSKTTDDVIWGQKLTSIPTPTKSYNRFDGWYNGSTKLTTSIVHKSCSTYTASWKGEIYTITLNNQSATTAGTSSIYEQYGVGYFTNSSATTQMTTSSNPITVPKKTGYTFNGYYTSTNGSGIKYIDSNGKLTSNASSTRFTSAGTLYAYWTANTYSISYNLNSGSYGSYHPTSGTTDTVLTIDNPTRVGYTFAGWTTSTSAGLGSSAKTGTTSSPSTSWNGSATKNTYFKNLRDTSGTVTLTATWTANSYTISYNLNGGSYGSYHPTSGTTESVLTIDNPTREGYTFTGWTTSTSAGLGSNAKTGTSSSPSTSWTGSSTKNRYFKNLRETSGTVTLTANWTENTYTIAFNNNGGSGTMSSLTGVKYSESKVLTKNTFTKSGYTFQGWATSQTGAKIYDDGAVVSKLSSTNGATVTLYAVWQKDTYTITYTLNGGTNSTSNPSTYQVDSNTINLQPPTRTGYTFQGWTGSNGGTPQTSVSIPKGSTGNKTYTANWLSIEYTIAYNLDGGTLASGSNNPTTGKGDTDVNVANHPTKTGYTFAGWTSNATAGLGASATTGTSANPTATWNGSLTKNKYFRNLRLTSGTVYLTANWNENTYSISFNNNGGSGSMNSISGIKYTDYEYLPLNTFTKLGYVFKGWATSATGSKTYDDGQSVNKLSATNGATVTLYAVWEKATYTITYNLDGGTNASSNPATYQVDTNTITLQAPTKTGYIFAGWTGDNGTSPQTSVSIPKGSTGNKTYTANWTKDTYTITYNLDGGTNNSSNPSTYQIDTNTITLQDPTKEGYNFTGWTGSNGSSPQRNVTIAKGSTGNKTYTANWSRDTYTITYNLNGGTNHPSNPSTYQIDASTITLQAPTKTGYTFAGWTGSNGTTPQTNVAIVTGSTGNKTFAANWTANIYTIEYSLNGGALASGTTNPTSGSYDTDVTIVNEPNKTGYTFTGWSTNASAGLGSNAKTGTSQNPTTSWNGATTKNKYYRNLRDTSGTVILTANYSENTYTIAFNNNGGTGTMPSITGVRYTESKTLTSNTFTRLGYTFKGWATSQTGSKVYDDGAVISTLSATNGATVTLYAVWQKDTYSITYSLDGGTNNSLNPSSYQVDTATINLQEPTKIGYTFTGWTGSNGTTPQTSVAIVTGSTGNKTFAANWSSNGYGIDYNLDGGELELGKTNPASGRVDSDVFIANEPIKTGYTFTGWTSNSTAGLGANATTGTSSNPTTTWSGNLTKNKYFKNLRETSGTVILTANWSENSYTIAFNNNSGTGNMSNITGIRYTENKTLPSNTFTKTGYTFTGWSTTAEGTKEYNNGATVSKLTGTNNATVTLYAVWQKDTYTITYNLGGGTNNASNPSSYQVDTQTINIQAPSRDGYTFIGWTGSNGNNPQENISIVTGSTGNKTYTANWSKNTYTITYNLNGGILGQSNPTTYDVETNDITLNEPTKLGYTFQGWTGTNGSSPQKNLVIAKGSTGDRTYTANFSANTDTKYIVKYFLQTLDTEIENYEENVSLREQKQGTTDEIAQIKEEDIKDIEGFTYAADNSKNKLSGTVGANGSLILEVYYRRNIYTIRYETNGGTMASTTTRYYYGKRFVLSQNIKKGSSTFLGWYDNSDFNGNAITYLPEGETGDKVFYAKWTSGGTTLYVQPKDNKCVIEEGSISQIGPNTKLSDLANKINTNGTIVVKNKKGQQIGNNDLIGTGYTIEVSLNGQTKTYEISITGDIDGNGKISMVDVVKANEGVLGKISLTSAQKKAADLSGDSRLTLVDIVKMNQAYLGKIKL